MSTSKESFKILNVGAGKRAPSMVQADVLRVWNVFFDRKVEWINIDKEEGPFIDHRVNLDNLKTQKLPYPDSHFDAIIMIHVFEHIWDVWSLMDELYRICKPNGKCYILCPYWTSKWSIGDIDHKRMINEFTFQWFDKRFYELQKEDSPISPCLITCNWEYNFTDIKWQMKCDAYGVPHIDNICPVLTCKK
jgi:ubiquinone/menaquinone biosynthesis C-methylase UbiE